MKSLAHILAAALVLFIAATGSQTAQSTPLVTLYLPLVCTEPGTLAFTATTRFVNMGPTGIASVAIRGAVPTFIKLDGANEYSSNPAYSSDGKHIAFIHSQAGRSFLALMNPDGSGLVHLTTIIRDGSDMGGPTWSPDGTQIAFESAGTIEIVNADGSNVHTLVADATLPAWSPDGTRIAFARSGIMTIAPNGSSLKQISTLAVHAALAWSPDSQHLAFANQSNDIVIMTANGVVQREISHLGLADSIADISWSPDGAWLAYEGYIPLYDIFVGTLRVDGTKPERLQNSGWAFDPAWRP